MIIGYEKFVGMKIHNYHGPRASKKYPLFFILSFPARDAVSCAAESANHVTDRINTGSDQVLP